MNIRSILGKCVYKGCKEKYAFTAEMNITLKNGKTIKKKFKLCEIHSKELLEKGKLKSVTYEENVEND